MHHITVRNVPDDLAKALLRHKRETGLSMNQTVIDLLGRAVGLSRPGAYDNGLGELAGGWTEEEAYEFERDTRQFAEIDKETWR